MADKKYILDFAVRVADLKIKPAVFKKIMERGAAILRKEPHLKPKMSGGVIHVVLTDDDDIAFLNGVYRGKDQPTDVISLSYFDEMNFPGENDLVGEIMISVDTARKQARKSKTGLEHELRFLFAHGLLHLFGYDHKSAAEKKAMFKLQDKILGK
jgi:probable rRNA maturation factor